MGDLKEGFELISTVAWNVMGSLAAAVESRCVLDSFLTLQTKTPSADSSFRLGTPLHAQHHAQEPYRCAMKFFVCSSIAHSHTTGEAAQGCGDLGLPLRDLEHYLLQAAPTWSECANTPEGTFSSTPRGPDHRGLIHPTR